MSDDFKPMSDHDEIPTRVRVTIEEGNERFPGLLIRGRVCDGPETYQAFDPALPLVQEEDDAAGTLAHAIAETVNLHVESAVENEASLWTQEHTEVYVVVGATGEDGVWDEWFVRAFLNRSFADGFCSNLKAWCREHGLEPGGPNATDVARRLGTLIKCPDDPAFRCDVAGTAYHVTAVPLDMRHAWL